VGTITTGITDSPQYLILNQAIGENSLLSASSEALVDWVHVYSHDASARAVAAQSGYTGPGGLEQPDPTPDPGQVLKGTLADEVLSGATGADSLFGMDGNDTLN